MIHIQPDATRTFIVRLSLMLALATVPMAGQAQGAAAPAPVQVAPDQLTPRVRERDGIRRLPGSLVLPGGHALPASPQPGRNSVSHGDSPVLLAQELPVVRRARRRPAPVRNYVLDAAR